MPYLHLPLQSGSDRILKAMNRRHNRGEYLEIIAKLRDANPELGFSSDFIVGFPGETDQDFEATLDMVEQVGYIQAFSFKIQPPRRYPRPQHIPIRLTKKSNRSV